MRRRWPITTIGLTFLLQGEAKKHNISMFEPEADAYREWLESRDPDSVVYVSFGSFVSLEKEQMAELGHALLTTGCHFLWVVRSSELDKLPVWAAGKGLVVEWCHQPEVLSGRGVVGGFRDGSGGDNCWVFVIHTTQHTRGLRGCALACD
ncbi:UDP glycosyltransferase 9-like [Salvia divinorum]|uniref:UDP glycosyltransferase 9-like n=1 Tax=Salvia divinorum TaxID=28513 RepID=A0ABD1HY64_SALDI